MEAGAARAGEAAVPAPAPAPLEKKSGFRDFLEEMGELTIFCWQALKALPGTLRYFSEILRLNAVITRRTSLLQFVMCMFLGISLANFGFYFLRSIGASDFVGVLPGLITPRQ